MPENRENHDTLGGHISINGLIRRLYISHSLSAWNSRIFEFGAILFLASIYPGTLLYASIYALVRSFAATILAARIGTYLDHVDRLVAIRHGIVWQRASVILSCALFYVVLVMGDRAAVKTIAFLGLSVLACVEKLASLGSTVAVERDWIVVICADDNTGPERSTLNAGMRRIDLFCKLVAPVFISFVDATMGTRLAVLVVLVLSALSVAVEYFVIARVYYAVPALRTKDLDTTFPDGINTNIPAPTEPLAPERMGLRSMISNFFHPWTIYVTNPAFLPSLSLSLLYLTVLSTGPHWQTYLLATDYTPLTVSALRILAVISELSATCLAPYLMSRIGSTRTGLWSINWQVLTLAPAVGLFYHIDSIGSSQRTAGAILTAGIIVSRLGLWSFDLSVQFLVQDGTSASTRAVFSSCEVALQNLFEMLSFAATIAFAEPSQFVYPALVSLAAVTGAAACFAGYVRKERGHLLHASRCLGGEKRRYERVGEEDVDLESVGTAGS